MSLAALAQLESRHEALIGALDTNDPHAISAATRELEAALLHVRAVGSWNDDPDVKRAAERIRPLADAAMMRLNVLADQARRRAEAVALTRGRGDALTYRR